MRKSYHGMPFFATVPLTFAMLLTFNGIPSYAMPSYAINVPSYAIPSYAMPCYAMLCYSILPMPCVRYACAMRALCLRHGCAACNARPFSVSFTSLVISPVAPAGYHPPPVSSTSGIIILPFHLPSPPTSFPLPVTPPPRCIIHPPGYHPPPISSTATTRHRQCPSRGSRTPPPCWLDGGCC